MDYADAGEALRDTDARTGLLLLEQAAQETGFSSDILNDAYTLALYRAGEKTRLADTAFQIADAFVQTDPASAMDYFQRDFLGVLDAARDRHIWEIFERWAAPKPPRRRRSPSAKPTKVKKVAHVIGCFRKDHAPARHVDMLTRSLRQQGVESQVFTTEWAASWF